MLSSIKEGNEYLPVRGQIYKFKDCTTSLIINTLVKQNQILYKIKYFS